MEIKYFSLHVNTPKDVHIYAQKKYGFSNRKMLEEDYVGRPEDYNKIIVKFCTKKYDLHCSKPLPKPPNQ